MSFKALIFGISLIGLAAGIGIPYLQGYKHPEYHINAQLPSGAHVKYEEQPWLLTRRNGHLEIKSVDGTALTWYDWDNDLRLSKGDSVSVKGSDSSLKFEVDPANPNIENIVRQLRPQIDSVLEQALEHNTAPLRK